MPKPFKTIVEELRGIRQQPRKYMNKKSHIAPEGCLPQPHPSLSSSFLALPMIPADGDGNGDEEQQSPWAHLPPELILDIIKRVETTGTCWPGRRDVVVCAAVCRSWRDIVSDLVKTPQQCGLITFPISLKQPGPKEHPIQCLIRRERSTSTYRLYIGLGPGLSVEESKLLLSAKKIRRVTCLDFIISLVANDYSRASSNYVGKLRSNFLGTKFTIFDNQSSLAIPSQLVSKRSHRRVQSQQFTSTQTPGSCLVTSISYELNVLRTRGPRRMNCTVHSIPMASLQEGGTAPTPTTFSIPDAGNHLSKRLSLPSTDDVRKSPLIDINPKSPLQESSSDQVNQVQKTLVLKNKAPRWHEQLQCWCLNFKGRVTVASVKNFQLVASVEPEDEVPPGEQEKVILQFGKIGKDIFTMDYRYPLSAFQAFAICLTSFDTKPACE